MSSKVFCARSKARKRESVALVNVRAPQAVRRRRGSLPGPTVTATEFTVDVLAATAADPQATQDLKTLYHQARFSSHGVGRVEVDQATICLGILASSWDAVSMSVTNPSEAGQL